MEKIIFVLLPIIYFIYKAYINFNKEQEKAKKRAAENAGKSNIPSSRTEQNSENDYRPAQQFEYQTVPDLQNTPENLKEENYYYESDIREYLDKNKKDQANERKKLADVNKADKVAVLDYYNPEIPSAEVLANRAIHEPHNHGFEFPHPFQDEGINFDLHAAIVYRIILERPTY